MIARRRIFLVLAGLLTRGHAATSCQAPVMQLPLGACNILIPGQSDVHSWGAPIGIEGASDLCLVPSTVLAHTFLTTESVCGDGNKVDVNNVEMTDAQCRSRRGGYILSSENLPSASTDGLAAANPAWLDLKNSIDSASQGTLEIQDQEVTMTVGRIEKGQQSTASHLGLALDSVLLKTLKDKGLIGAQSFGLNAGSQSILAPRRGSLVLGGYDPASIGSHFWEFPIKNTKLQDRHCPLQVKVNTISLVGTVSNGTASQPVNETISGNAEPVDYCIEP